MQLTDLQKERFKVFYKNAYYGTKAILYKLTGKVDEQEVDYIISKLLNRYIKMLSRIRNEKDYDNWINTWMYSAIRGLAHQYFNEMQQSPTFTGLEEGYFVPEQKPEVSDLTHKVIKAIQLLKKGNDVQSFQALELYLQDYKYEEISKILDTPLNTIKGQIHRAKIKLHKTLL